MSDWLTDAARRPINPEPAELPEGLHYGDDGKVLFHCGGCDQFKEWIGEPADFVLGDPNNRCGGSPRCCP